MAPEINELLRTLVADAVRAEVQAAVEAALERALPEVIRRARYPEYLTREDAAYIGRSVRSLDYLRSAGKLPYVRRRGRVLLAVAALDASLAEGHVPAKGTPVWAVERGDVNGSGSGPGSL